MPNNALNIGKEPEIESSLDEIDDTASLDDDGCGAGITQQEVALFEAEKQVRLELRAARTHIKFFKDILAMDDYQH